MFITNPYSADTSIKRTRTLIKNEFSFANIISIVINPLLSRRWIEFTMQYWIDILEGVDRLNSGYKSTYTNNFKVVPNLYAG